MILLYSKAWEIITEQFNQLAAIIPNLAGALAVVLIGWELRRASRGD